MLYDLDKSFPTGSNPTDEEIEEIIHGEWVLENVESYISHFDLVYLLNEASNYDNYAILNGSEPYYKYFTQ
jgi:hypothetical protein